MSVPKSQEQVAEDTGGNQILCNCGLAHHARPVQHFPSVADPSRIFWSADGTGLGVGELRSGYYSGSSVVTAMITYKQGVLTAFQGPHAGKHGNAIHRSENGSDLGGGDPTPYYDGSSPVVAMTPFKGGLLTAFSNAGGDKGGHRICSRDGKGLGEGELRYDGSSPRPSDDPICRWRPRRLFKRRR